MKKLFLLSIFFFGSLTISAQAGHPLEGKWNLTIQQEGKELPSWLEVKHSGNNTLIGRFTYAFGSARPIAEVKKYGDLFYFSIPPQWEPGAADMEFQGKKVGQELRGTMVYTDGNTYEWTAVAAPKLPTVAYLRRIRTWQRKQENGRLMILRLQEELLLL